MARKLLSRDQAWSRIAKHAAPLPATDCPLAEAAGRHLAQPAISPIDVPGFDRSAMDGYALRAVDTPDTLMVVRTIAAGDPPGDPIEPGTAARIFTGAAIPPGADAVERQEATSVKGNVDAVIIKDRVKPGQHIRRAGEDIAAGTTIAPAGARVTPGTLTAAASAGLPALRVHRPARVSILLTGDELVQPGHKLGPGQIYESNSVTLRALIERNGAEAIELGTAPDEPGAIANRVQLGLHRADILLICGGVSVGDRDHVKDVLADAGVQELFWGVKVKPGKPLFCGRRGDRWAFGLPGNPLSGVVGFLVFVEPLLRRMQGEPDALPRTRRARVTQTVGPSDDRTTYLTATFATAADGVLEATPTEAQGSAMTLALAQADGFIVAPDGQAKIKAGRMVDVLPL